MKKNYFILSKGHASIGAYSVMHHLGFISKKAYDSFCNFNSDNLFSILYSKDDMNDSDGDSSE